MRADSDFGDDRRARPRGSALGVLRTVGRAVLFTAAVAILYLAFRPSSHPQAGTGSAMTSPPSPYATGAQGVGQEASAQPATVKPGTSAAAAPPASPSAGVGQAAGPLGAQA